MGNKCKNLYILFLFLAGIICKSQDNSIASSVLTPVAYQTGVPDISFPLGSLTAAKDFTLNFGLAYNPNSYKVGALNGNIARNWQLYGSNFMITRSVVANPDEYDSFITDWDDIYYYTVYGEQGSFKIVKTGVYPNDVYSIKKLTPSTLKIEFQMVPVAYSWMPRKIAYFHITDNHGYKYYFQDHDQNLVKIIGIDLNMITTHPINKFYVNKIEAPSGKTVALFQNKLYVKNGTAGNIEEQQYLPETIITDYGRLKFEHLQDNDSWAFHDRYYFKSVSLSDNNDKLITKYDIEIEHSSFRFFDIDLFQSLDPQTIKVRLLKRIKKVDKDGNNLEITKFQYNNRPAPPPSWGSANIPNGVFTKEGDAFLLHNLLNTVTLPAGARIQYKFGIHTLKKVTTPIDYNTPYYINQIQSAEYPEILPFNYKVKTDSIAFDSHITKKYYLTNLQKSPSSRIYIKFFKDETYPWSGNPENPSFGPGNPDPKLAYRVRGYTNVFPQGDPEIESFYSPHGFAVPSNGSAYLEITGSGGRGWFEIFEKFWTDPPYYDLNENANSDTGVKIEEIKYMNNLGQTKSLVFNYDLFNEAGVSSGIAVPDEQQEAILYKNIKVTESDKSGYTKYYYQTSWDFPHYPHPNIANAVIWPNYNITKKGLLEKKEVYDSNNKVVTTLSNNYSLPPVDLAKLYEVKLVCATCKDIMGITYTHEALPEKITSTENSYDSSGNSISLISEKTFNQANNNVMKEKNTTVDGIVSETDYLYAAEKGNTKLIGKDMHSVPLEVIRKQNGIETGRIETKYDHAENYFPSSVKTVGINGVVMNEVKHDIYDTMGNVLQTTSKAGSPTAFIYGYSSTLLIAKIEGATYQQVMSAFGLSASADSYKTLDIYLKSNQDIDDASEEVLRQKQDEFRLKAVFKDYLITTYTYDPLVGIKSVTSPSGNKEYYYYDTANRLIRVEDINHNIIKENKYSPLYE